MSNKPPSQNAIGRALGLSSAAMVKLKKQGCPMDSVEAAQAWREAHQNVASRKPAPAPVQSLPPLPLHDDYDGYSAPATEDHQAARTRREIAEANLAEMREAEERGDLIRIAAVKTTLASVFSTTRETLLQIPARLGPLLAADSDPASVQSSLHAEIHQALQHLAGAADRIGETEGVAE